MAQFPLAHIEEPIVHNLIWHAVVCVALFVVYYAWAGLYGNKTLNV